jgi:hypothetical protein
VQPENALHAIVVSLLFFSNMIFVKPVQPSNAKTPIEVTLFGIVILVKPA